LDKKNWIKLSEGVEVKNWLIIKWPLQINIIFSGFHLQNHEKNPTQLSPLLINSLNFILQL